jgi:hypothetical protein
MSWFNNKKEERNNLNEVPLLPELPEDIDFSMPKLQEYTKEPNPNKLPVLPEIKKPTTMSVRDFSDNKQMQKSPFPVVKYPMEEIIPPQKPVKPLISTPRTIETPELRPPKQIIKEIEPIYIRLDKFNITSESFEEIKRKVQEIESLLAKTKDIREKEQKELEEWEKEIQGIKARLDSIDKNLFKQLD